MQKKYSWYSLLKAGLSGQDWDQAIPLVEPKSKYDVHYCWRWWSWFGHGLLFGKRVWHY